MSHNMENFTLRLAVAALCLIMQATSNPRYAGPTKYPPTGSAFPPDNSEPYIYPDGMCFGPRAMETGLRQSPINLQRKYMSKAPICDNVGDVKDFTQETEATLRNTGHSVDFELLQSSPSFELGRQEVVYTLERMHYHWGSSEHRLDGKSFDGEFHMVFYNTMYPSFESAAKCTNGLLVVANWLKVSKQDNPNLEIFVRELHRIPFQNDTIQLKCHINLRQFLPKCNSKYFSYFGSLTTEPFSEVVKWIVIQDTVPISQRQLDEFKKLHTAGPGSKTINENAREVQPINGRLVLSTEHCKCVG